MIFFGTKGYTKGTDDGSGIIIYSAAILYENKELIEVIQRLATTYVLIICFCY